MPVLDREEYIEQAYFFHAFRERVLDGMPAQEVLSRVGEELLSTTRLPMAIWFLTSEIKVRGLMGPAMARIGHYFTPFQVHVVTEAEKDVSRFAMDQALLVLEREARYKADGPTPAGLFVYQFEALSRNRLGYGKGLEAMAGDPFYDEDWRDYILLLRARLGDVDFADLIFVRSAYLRDRATAPERRFRTPSSRSSSARRRGRSPAPTGAATRSTSSRPSSASSAIPRSPAPDAPTRPRPASPCSNSGSRSSRTA